MHEFLRQQQSAALFRDGFRPIGEETVDRERPRDAILSDIAEPLGQVVGDAKLLGRDCDFDTALGDDFIGEMLTVNAPQLRERLTRKGLVKGTSVQYG